MVKRITELAAKGMTQRQIAVIVNVNEVTLSTWKTHFREISEAIEKGQALGIERRLARIERAGKHGSWAADAWQLERRYPEQFARRVEQTGAGGGPIAVEDKTPLPRMDKKRLREIIAAVENGEEQNGEVETAKATDSR